MTNYNALIWICIAVVAVIGLLFASEQITNEWAFFGISVTIGIILFLVSVKINKSSMTTLFVLLDDSKRKILEKLEKERDFNELAQLLQIPDDKKGELTSNLFYLKKRNYILEKEKDGHKKYVRNF